MRSSRPSCCSRTATSSGSTSATAKTKRHYGIPDPKATDRESPTPGASKLGKLIGMASYASRIPTTSATTGGTPLRSGRWRQRTRLRNTRASSMAHAVPRLRTVGGWPGFDAFPRRDGQAWPSPAQGDDPLVRSRGLTRTISAWPTSTRPSASSRGAERLERPRTPRASGSSVDLRFRRRVLSRGNFRTRKSRSASMTVRWCKNVDFRMHRDCAIVLKVEQTTQCFADFIQCRLRDTA